MYNSDYSNVYCFLGLFALLALCFALITLGVHLYIFTKEAEWREAYEEYIM